MNALDYTLRPGTEADRPWMIDLARRTVDSSVASLRRPAPGVAGANAARLLTFAFEHGGESAVAETQLDRLGYIVWTHAIPDEITGEKQTFGIYMAVEPHARRGGVARALMLRMEESARAAGMPYLQFAVTEENVHARELYAQLGFQTERRILCKRF